MTEQDVIDLVVGVRDMAGALNDIRQSLAVIAGAMATAPDIRQPIQDYAGFDWSSIGAEVLRQDDDGPSVVRWNGKIFKRRSPSNKFEPSIWYSRCVGKNAEGNNNYETLISFDVIKDDVEPISPKARDLAFPGAKATRPARPEPRTQPAEPAGRQDAGGSRETPPARQSNVDDELDNLAEKLAPSVKRDGANYTVASSPTGSARHTLSKNNGRIVCSCRRFEAMRKFNPEARCEHVRALKLAAAQNAIKAA